MISYLPKQVLVIEKGAYNQVEVSLPDMDCDVMIGVEEEDEERLDGLPGWQKDECSHLPGSDCFSNRARVS
jgi:hypothetical protein